MSISSKSVPPQFGHESQFTGVGSASLTACRTNPQPWHSLKMSKQKQLLYRLAFSFLPSNLVMGRENTVPFASPDNNYRNSRVISKVGIQGIPEGLGSSNDLSC